MNNLIKMDLYRLVRTRALRTGLIAAVFISFFGMLAGLGLTEIFKFAGGVPVPFFAMSYWVSGVDYAELVLYGSGVLSLFVGCMVTASFIGAEQSCSYLKNLGGQLRDRGKTVLSKFVVCCIAQVAVQVVYILVSAVSAPLLFGSYINGWSVAQLVGALLLRLPLYFAVNAVIVFLCTLTKSHALAMVTGAVLGSGIMSLVYTMANTVMGMAKISLDISRYMPGGILGELSYDNLADIAPRALLVSAVVIAVFMYLAATVVKKRDVR